MALAAHGFSGLRQQGRGLLFHSSGSIAAGRMKLKSSFWRK
jgi:glutamate 5-kinase